MPLNKETKLFVDLSISRMGLVMNFALWQPPWNFKRWNLSENKMKIYLVKDKKFTPDQ